MKNYIGHNLQIRGAECVTLSGGKGDGMKYMIVRNGLGLEAWISLDRCADLTRVTFKGNNMGYMSPCGHVSPQYYDHIGAGFLKSFTAGFFTTAGLRAVGSPCVDDGEELPLHGNIANIPAETWSVNENEDVLTVSAVIRDCVIFGAKLVLNRKYTFSYTSNSITVSDTVTNEGDTATPYMILYHCNMGYPLLSENSNVMIPNLSCEARSEDAQMHIDTALIMQKPEAEFMERCYFFDVQTDSKNIATVGIFNNDIDSGVTFRYNKNQLPYFTEWKMMGKKDYVLGLEPGNCTPKGRDVLRSENKLMFLAEDESATTEITFNFHNCKSDFEGEFQCL